MISEPLAVLLSGRLVAELDRARSGSMRLRYVGSPSLTATPLSLSLPVGVNHTGATVERFVAGLLPENGDARAAIARRYRLQDPKDDLEVLRAIGKDCPGAVQFCALDEVESTLAREGSLVPCSLSDIEARLSEMSVNEAASWVMEGEHWSLGGTQQKFALRQEGGSWFEAHGSEPTTHIFKPGVRNMLAQALVEHVTMSAAVAVGIPTASTAYENFKSESSLVVTRFDRARAKDGSLVRLHQEDLCQALGVEQKYEDSGGPTPRAIAALLTDQASTRDESERNLVEFIDMLVFNTVTAAPDGHARNYAVMLDGDSVRLAPMFDAATALPYDVSGPRKLAMAIGGNFEAAAVTSAHWARAAEDLRVGEEYLLGRVQEISEAVPGAFRAAFASVDSAEAKLAWERMRPNLETLSRHFESTARRSTTPVLPAVLPGQAKRLPLTGDVSVRPHVRGGSLVRPHRRRRRQS